MPVVPPATGVITILLTLESRGYLAQDGDGAYRLTLRLLYGKARERAERLRDIARPHLKELAMRLTNRPGRVLPPHCSSMGKSTTAFQTPERADRIRKQGYAFGREEAAEGGFCVGAAMVTAVLETAQAIGQALDAQESDIVHLHRHSVVLQSQYSCWGWVALHKSLGVYSYFDVVPLRQLVYLPAQPVEWRWRRPHSEPTHS